MESACMMMERVEGKGEDQAVCMPDLACVFDGLGGAGCRLVRDPEGLRERASEAYVAARGARRIVEKLMGRRRATWQGMFAACSDEAQVVAAAGALRREFEEALDAGFLGLRGACLPLAARPAPATPAAPTRPAPVPCAPAAPTRPAPEVLPTNMAAVMLLDAAGATYGLALWAGDARCYAFDPVGLHQLSVDDNRSGDDAMQDLLHEAPVPQTRRLGYDVALEGTRLSMNIVRLDGPCVLMCATDGCYSAAQLASPMHLEDFLRWHFMHDGDLARCAAEMRRFFHRCGGDDCTLAMLPHAIAPDGLAAMAAPSAKGFSDAYLKGFPARPKLPETGDALRTLGCKLDASEAFRASAAHYLRGVVDGPPEACPAEFQGLLGRVKEVREALDLRRAHLDKLDRARAELSVSPVWEAFGGGRGLHGGLGAPRAYRELWHACELLERCRVELDGVLGGAGGSGADGVLGGRGGDIAAELAVDRAVEEYVVTAHLGTWYAFLEHPPFEVDDPGLREELRELGERMAERRSGEEGLGEATRRWREDCMRIWAAYKPSYERFARRL